MDAATNTPLPSAPEDATPDETSLLDRLTGVITSPGEVFEEIKGRPVAVSNWLAPLALACALGILYCVMAFSQPAVVQGMQDQRVKAIQKQVQAGKMTQDQADKASAMMDKIMSPTILKIFGGGGAIMASSIGLFLMAFWLWGGLKLFTEAGLDYMKVVEVCGLALVLDVLQKIVRTWLVTWKQNMMVTLSPTLFLAHPDMQNRMHVLLSVADPLDFWWLAVLSLGISKVASVRYGTAAALAFGGWFLLRGLQILMIRPQ